MPAEATRHAALGRLHLPPADAATGTVPAGRSTVQVHGQPVGLWYVPRSPARRLVLLLHGAGGTADDGLRLLLPHADTHHLMLYAPQSLGPTWDVIRGGYGPDVDRIQAALSMILGVHRVPALAIGGFSDGASYALSLGIVNGDHFDAVLAFSPGFAAATARADSPAIFVSHGRDDGVLPIDRCSRRLVPSLTRSGYPVRYREFDGGHVVPEAIVEEALSWLSAVPVPDSRTTSDGG